MTVYKKRIDFETKSQIEFVNITEHVQEIIDESHVRDGQVLVYSPHTTMSVAVNHDESLLLQDFNRILYKLAPMDDQYKHDLFELKKGSDSDGRSNGHSHCKSIFLGNSETFPIEKGTLLLGKRQSVFAVELDGARKRDIIVQVMGE